MADDNSDDGLGARLDSALRSGLELGSVDVATLLEGSRHRARQVRFRRIASVTAAAVIAVAFPVGYETPTPDVNAATPSAMLGSSSRPDANHTIAPVHQPKPTAVPSVPP